jgi:hypothetical protein
MRDSADSDGYGITRRGKKRGKFTMTSRPTPSAAGTCAGYDVCLATRSSRSTSMVTAPEVSQSRSPSSRWVSGRRRLPGAQARPGRPG